MQCQRVVNRLERQIASCWVVSWRGTLGCPTSTPAEVNLPTPFRYLSSSIDIGTHNDTIRSEDMKICVVGSGPAGFYVADRISKRLPGSSIDVLEKLPSPYGLVRSGVAPDHPDTKNVIHQFHELMERGTVKFLGNVPVGDPDVVSLNELRHMYHAVVLAYGAGAGKRLSLPGDDASHTRHNSSSSSGTRNVVSARDFVNWYNGHPDGNEVDVRMEGVRDVVICGLGNVALDCARILLKDPLKDLHPTDISSRAVEALRRARIANVHVLSRRGPAQAACTPKELRELLSLPDVDMSIHPPDCLNKLSDRCEEEIKKSRIHRRVLEVFRKKSGEGLPGHKHVHFHFLSSPAKYVDTDGQVSSVYVQKMRLEDTGGDHNGGAQKAVRTDEEYCVDSQLVIESVGYHAEPIQGAPFDHKTGTIPHVLGKVLDDGSEDLYVCGWLKRGPSGIIGTNLVDAEQTVDTMVRHASHWGSMAIPQESKTGRQGLLQLLSERNRYVVGFKGWLHIDTEEVARGAALGKVREKITSIDDMLAIGSQSEA